MTSNVIPFPKTNKWLPHNYQLTAISFLLVNPQSGLFLDPGLGKTSISLSTIKILKNSGKIRGVLLVAPLRVCHSTWPDEILKWFNFNNLTYTVLHEENKESLWGEKKDIYLINPEGIKWLHDSLLNNLKAGKKCPVDVLWIDESTKFKNQESIRFDLIVNMLPLFKRRHIMTGTPAPKSLLDLWSQMYILDEGKTLGSNYYEYRNKYFETDDWNKYNWNLKDFQEDEIHKKIAPKILEMSATDYLKLPPLIYNNISIELPDDAMKYYKKMENDLFIKIDDLEASAEARVTALGKCHQIANGKVYEDIPEDLDDIEIRLFKKTRKVLPVHTAKLEALQDLIDELNGKPLLVAYHYQHDLKSLLDLLGKDTPYIGKGISPIKTRELVKQWNSGDIQVLLCNPASMSHGLNMQDGGHDICWYSLTWNLEFYIQFIARLFRQGVKNTVRVHHLISKNTTDEAMLSRLGERAEQQQNLRTALKMYRNCLQS